MATDIAGLIERLEKATGADRELDGDVCAFFKPGARGGRGIQAGAVIRAGAMWSAEPVTASLDAAMALVERVRPDLCVENLGEMSPDCGPLAGHWLAQLRPRKPRPRVTSLTPEAIRASLDAFGPVSAATPAIALCLALLRTLETNNGD